MFKWQPKIKQTIASLARRKNFQVWLLEDESIDKREESMMKARRGVSLARETMKVSFCHQINSTPKSDRLHLPVVVVISEGAHLVMFPFKDYLDSNLLMQLLLCLLSLYGK